MHWTHDRHQNIPMTVLAITQEELPALKRAVKQSLCKLRKNYDKLNDIHESGEATDKQQTKLCYLKEEMNTLENFLNQ